MQLNTKATRYLLRFDDLCPTMNWQIWSEIETALIENNLKPMLAIVPDNQDPALQVDAAPPEYWERVRSWQSRGWDIALHGYQHRYVTRHPGLVTVRKKSEFAGLSAGMQEEKLRRGVEIFRNQGIQTRLWIAPGNSFDSVTVSLLPKFGISMVCDGHFRFPFVCRYNLFWIPQQLFRFRPAPPGVWTVCYHHNTWSSDQLRQFRRDLEEYRAELSSLDDVVREWTGHYSAWGDFLCTSPRISPVLIRTQLKLAAWWRPVVAGSPPSLKQVSTLQPR